MQSHRHQESETVPDLLDDIPTYQLLLFRKSVFEAFKPLQQIAKVNTGQFTDMLSIDLKESRFFLDPIPFTIRAKRNRHKSLRPLTDFFTGRGLIPPLEHIDDTLRTQVKDQVMRQVIRC